MRGFGIESYIRRVRATESRSNHSHKVSTNDAITSSTGGFRDFYKCVHWIKYCLCSSTDSGYKHRKNPAEKVMTVRTPKDKDNVNIYGVMSVKMSALVGEDTVPTKR